MNYDSPKAIAELLAAEGLALNKRFGQNFLVSRSARERILSIAAPTRDDRVWEVGPGIGTMTHVLAGSVRELVAFEIDRGFARLLERTLGGAAGFRVVVGDFLKTWEAELRASGAPELVVGNLPYNSASAIIGAIVRGAADARIVATVQRELADRIAARPGTKEYSSFSILCQSGYEVIRHGELKAGSFYPAPDVVSSIVELRPARRFAIEDRALFFELVRALFAARRKTIRNNLAQCGVLGGLDAARLQEAAVQSGIALDGRAERLSVGEIVAYANRLAALRPESQPGASTGSRAP